MIVFMPICFCLLACPFFHLAIRTHHKEAKEQIEDGLLVSPPKLTQLHDTFFLPLSGKLENDHFFYTTQKSTNTKNVKKRSLSFPLL